MKDYEKYPGDELKPRDKRLRFKWQWCRVATDISRQQLRYWTRFQVSECFSGKDWKLEAIQWGSENTEITYEANVSYLSNDIVNKEGFKTRLEAQIGAEKLLIDWILEQRNKFINLI